MKSCLHLRPSILAYAARIGFQTVFDSLVPQEAVSYDIPLQRVLMVGSQFKEIADLSMLRKNPFSF